MTKKLIAFAIIGALSCASVGLTAALAGKTGKRESRAAALAARQGLVVVKKWGPDVHQQWVEERNAEQFALERGTKVSPHPLAKGAMLQRHNQVAHQFPPHAPVPPQRPQHYAWMNNPDLHVRGWIGTVQEVDGSRVKIAFLPFLVSEKGGTPFTPYRHVETYEFSNGAFQYVGGEAARGDLQMIFHD